MQDIRAPAVSPSRHDVLIQFAMKGDPDTAANRVQPVLDAVSTAQAAYPGVTIQEFGDASANKWFSDTITRDLKRAEWTVVPLALGILLVVFGALVAALLPVVLALTAFLAANGLLALISHAMHVDSSASSVMLLMGMAVGVDYCLFYLRREREERARGWDPEAALRIAAATSGRSVLISGMTVIVAMAGMFLAGMQLFAGLRRRDHPGGAHRHGGVGDGAARPDVAARQQGRVRADTVPRAGAPAGGRQPGVEGRAGPGAGPAGNLRRAGGAARCWPWRRRSSASIPKS